MSTKYDPTTEALMKIVAMTLCLEPYDMFRKCAESNNLNFKKPITDKSECYEQSRQFGICRAAKLHQAVQWCMMAEGCDEVKGHYLMCLEKNGMGNVQNQQGIEKAHQKCMKEYEMLMKCGTESIIRDLESV
eukprot:PhF_6_TR4031/c0_g1_i1/m.5538